MLQRNAFIELICLRDGSMKLAEHRHCFAGQALIFREAPAALCTLIEVRKQLFRLRSSQRTGGSEGTQFLIMLMFERM